MIGVTIIIGFVCTYTLIRVGKKHNKTNWQHKWLNILDGINTWLCRNYHGLPDELIDIPETGPVLMVSNHVSGLDPLLLIAATNRPLRFMIAQEEFDRWWLKWLLTRVGCIPVKRDKNPTRAFTRCLNALENNQVVVVFPQGGIVAEPNFKALKKGAFVLAKITGVPLSCVRIDGVKARGFTLLALFVKSKVKITKHINIYQVTDKNMNKVMEDVNRSFQ